jgi:ankyrin repeat protein
VKLLLNRFLLCILSLCRCRNTLASLIPEDTRFPCVKAQNLDRRVDYSKLNGHHIDKLKNYLSKQKNDKQLLNKIFRSRSDTTLLYHAVNHDANFAAYLIQFAIENDVDSRSLLGSGNHLEVLHAAIKKRNYELVEMFLKHSVNQRRYTSLFDVDTFYDPTPFQIAINMEDIRSMNTIFRFSVENGVGAVKLLGLTKGEQSALHYAIHKRSCLDVMRAIVSLARDNGVDVALLFRAWCSGMTALRSASRVNSKMVNCVIELAKECGICAKKLTGPDSDGNTPLHYAAMESDEDSVEAIWNFAMDSGVVVASLFQSHSNKTPLHFAASNVSHNTFDTVLWRAKNDGVPLDLLLQKDSYGQTPLHLLAQNHTATTAKYEKAVKDILRLAHQGSQLAAILKRDKHGQTPLDYAACKSNEGIARAILQSVAQLDQEMVHVLLQPDTCGKTPLHLAAQEKKDRAAIEIMQAAAGSGRETVKTILAPDKSGRTPLGLALSYTGMQFGDFGYKITTGEAIMRFALENGVDWRTLIDIKDAALRLKLKEIFYEQIICDSRIWPRLYPSQSR